MADAIQSWLEATALSRFMNWSWWAWPTAESLHFVGLTLLLGTVGLFDLRLLGFARGLPLASLRALLPWGIGGFAISIFTGALFFTGIPGQYLHNPAFQAKAVLLAAAGANVLLFELVVGHDGVDSTEAGEQAPLAARIFGGVSLVLWISVLCAGRLIAFYKP